MKYILKSKLDGSVSILTKSEVKSLIGHMYKDPNLAIKDLDNDIEMINTLGSLKKYEEKKSD